MRLPPATAVLLISIHIGAAALYLAGPAGVVAGFPIDDAWIHMVYGRSVFEHGLPYYNPGELETGFTSPLWVACLAAAHAIAALAGAAPVTVAKAMGVGFAIATSLLVFDVVRQLTRDRRAAMLGALWTAVSPTLLFAAVSGMEVSLACATALFTMALFARGRLLAAGVAAAAALLARPECGLLAAVLVVAAICRRGATPAGRARDAARLGLPAAAAAILWMTYCLVATGAPLPNTFYAKIGSAASSRWPAAVIEMVGAIPGNALAGGIILVAVAILGARRSPDRRTAVVLLSLPWLLWLGVATSRALPEGFTDFFFWQRYGALALPLWTAAMALGWHALQRRGRLAAAAGTALAVVAFAPYYGAITGSRRTYAANCGNIEEVQVAAAHWVAAHTPAGAAIAVNDAGALRYFGQRRVIDLLGLNSEHMLGVIQMAGRSAADMARCLEREHADYLVVFGSWFPAVMADPALPHWFEPTMHFQSEHYTVAPATSGQDRMDLFRLRGKVRR